MACASTLDVILSTAPCRVCDIIDMVVLCAYFFTWLDNSVGRPKEKKEETIRKPRLGVGRRQ